MVFAELVDFAVVYSPTPPRTWLKMARRLFRRRRATCSVDFGPSRRSDLTLEGPHIGVVDRGRMRVEVKSGNRSFAYPRFRQYTKAFEELFSRDNRWLVRHASREDRAWTSGLACSGSFTS